MKELLFSVTKKDLDISFFSGSGAGGQHRNKHKNCVRMKHRDSGTTATGQAHKERKANLKEAFVGLTKHSKFKLWQSMRIQEVLKGKSIEKEVEEMIQPENLKVEYRENKKWVKGEL